MRGVGEMLADFHARYADPKTGEERQSDGVKCEVLRYPCEKRITIIYSLVTLVHHLGTTASVSSFFLRTV